MPARNTQAMQDDGADASKTLVNRVSTKLVKIASTKMVDGDSPQMRGWNPKIAACDKFAARATDDDPGTDPVKPRIGKVTPD